MNTDIDTLNMLVTGAIWRAENLDELKIETAPLAWLEVSKLEENIANAISAKETEGRIARRGAVRAALKSKDTKRAYRLVEGYTAESGAPAALCSELKKMLKADTEEMWKMFPFAAKHYQTSDAQSIAAQLSAYGPFGLGRAA